MRKFITYIGFAIATTVVVVVFVTSATYTQLAIAVILYPPLVYFALKIFPRKAWQTFPSEQLATLSPMAESIPEDSESGVVDVEKRDFLKLIGVSGISFVLYWIFTNQARGPLLGNFQSSETTTLKDIAGNKINPAERQLTDGYNITEIDDSIISYFGFTHKDNSWFIMRRDTETGSFRYIRGNSNFISSWENREQLKYDYYENAF